MHVWITDECSQLELNVESAAGLVSWLIWLRWVEDDLSVRSADWSARDDDGGCTSVVTDWKVGIVLLESVGWATEHGANVEGVVDSREEISVIANLHWEVHLNPASWNQGSLLELLVVFEDGGVGSAFREDILDVCADCFVSWAAESSECVKRWLGKDGEVVLDGWKTGETAVLGECLKVEGVVTNGNCWALGGRGLCADDTEWNVGDGEVRIRWDLEPALGCHFDEVCKSSEGHGFLGILSWEGYIVGRERYEERRKRERIWIE